MAVGLDFTPSGFNKDKYDEAIRKLEEAGAAAPAGRTFHVALDSEGAIQVFDIWESQASADRPVSDSAPSPLTCFSRAPM